MAGEGDYSVKFGQQQFLIEGEPGTGFFTAPCGITGLTRSVNVNTNDIDLPPCDDPDAVVWLGIDPVSKRMQLTFTGTLADVAQPTWEDWSMSEGSDDSFRLCRWYRNIGEDNQGYWEGRALLTEYSEASEGRGRWTNSGTVIWDGRPEFHAIPPAPENTVLPELTGTAEVGAVDVAVDDGTWSGTPSFTYQWRADGVNIAGANAATYTPAVDDEGKMLDVLVTGTNVSGSFTVLSNSLGPIAPAP